MKRFGEPPPHLSCEKQPEVVQSTRPQTQLKVIPSANFGVSNCSVTHLKSADLLEVSDPTLPPHWLHKHRTCCVDKRVRVSPIYSGDLPLSPPLGHSLNLTGSWNTGWRLELKSKDAETVSSYRMCTINYCYIPSFFSRQKTQVG